MIQRPFIWSSNFDRHVGEALQMLLCFRWNAFAAPRTSILDSPELRQAQLCKSEQKVGPSITFLHGKNGTALTKIPYQAFLPLTTPCIETTLQQPPSRHHGQPSLSRTVSKLSENESSKTSCSSLTGTPSTHV